MTLVLNILGDVVMDITVMNVSHYKREYNDYHAVTENGFGSDIYLFVHFILPAAVIIDGERYVTEPNACIFYTPGTRQEYGHIGGRFLNGFLIFKTSDQFILERHGLPQNNIFYVREAEKISFLLELIAYTLLDKLVDRKEETIKHLQSFFETCSKLCIDNNPNQKRAFEIKQRFIAMRDEVQKDPKDWTIEEMAKRVWYTRSRFTVMYNQFFGKPPAVDLIEMKLAHAKKLLKTTDMPVAKVAEACGYTSVEHFIRIFKKHEKITPLQFRKNG